MNKYMAVIILLIVTLGVTFLSLAACDWEGIGEKSILGTPQPGQATNYDLTATYGAEQLYIQLTAVAIARQNGQLSSTGGAPGP